MHWMNIWIKAALPLIFHCAIPKIYIRNIEHQFDAHDLKVLQHAMGPTGCVKFSPGNPCVSTFTRIKDDSYSVTCVPELKGE